MTWLSAAHAGRALSLEASTEVLVAKEQQTVEPAAAVNQLPPLLVRSDVRKETCPHGCGFTDNQDAVFNHKSSCPKRHDKILSKVKFFHAADDIRGGNSGGDRHCQMMAKRRMGVDVKYQRALSLEAIGRRSADTFQPNAGSYNHCYGSEARRLDENKFCKDNFLLQDLKNGRLNNPYDLTGPGGGGLPGSAAAGAGPQDPRRDPRLDATNQLPGAVESASPKKRRMDASSYIEKQCEQLQQAC
ncbi:hypothetical protein T484DRAFT_1809732 [Baffinella frigidus]|nr:hypothetical protein T484DRAFT_1809732 [Cryptophyta sp. CCMP2293]